MAIRGVKQADLAAIASPEVCEAVEVTVELLQLLDLVQDEEQLHYSLAGDYSLLQAIGPGRLYIALPASVPTSLLVTMINELAGHHAMSGVQLDSYWNDAYWMRALTDAEMNGTQKALQAKLALHSAVAKPGVSVLLHHTNWPLHRVPGLLTSQSILVGSDADYLEANFAASAVRAADHRDYMVWCLMDLLRGMPPDKMPLADGGILRIPALGVRDSGSARALTGCVMQSSEALVDARGVPADAGDAIGVGMVIGLVR